MQFLFLAGGAICGAGLRYIFTQLFTKGIFAQKISSAVILSNISGSIIFALLIYFSRNLNLNEAAKIFIFTGFLASFTTYSTFIFELATLINDQEFLAALSYFALSFFVPLIIMLFAVIKYGG